MDGENETTDETGTSDAAGTSDASDMSGTARTHERTTTDD